MTAKTPKLTLNQETIKNLTEAGRGHADISRHTCPPSVGIPVCTPVVGAN